ncbi:MAG TPA: NAD(P)H-dependent oxidoreductase subunit E [Longimicrobiales bacterium]|nr:NAD(P)H-dependent oxidoreductase subunit E [Longimicrobiales bacterium]
MIQIAKNVESVLARHPGAGRDSLIPILQEIQESVGYLPPEAMMATGQHLGLPASKVYGVATFYNQFRFKPKGAHHFTICRGTACHVKGAAKVLDRTAKLLKLQPGQTSRDRQFSLEVVECIGACGLAPVMKVNGEFHTKVTPMRLNKLIHECRENGSTPEKTTSQ